MKRLIWVLLIVAASASAQSFSSATSVSVSNRPTSVVVADVNLYSKPDLLTANRVGNSVSVRLGDGLGGFIGTSNFSVGTSPLCVVVSDVNLDGKPDFLTANDGSDNVSVRFGNGAGGFTGSINYSVGNHPQSLFVADLNSDGKPDIIAANEGSDNVTVRLGNGDGTFGFEITTDVGDMPFGVFIADINSDSKPDLLTGNNNGNDVTVRLGNGDGTFSSGTTYNVGNKPHSVFVADVNSDGKQDFLTANNGSDNVSLRLGNGDGTFGSLLNISVGDEPRSVFVADINMDGKLDLLTANNGSDNVSVRLGNGFGSFGVLTNIPVGNEPRGLFVADINNDGKPDFLTANHGSNTVSVALNITIIDYIGAPSGISPGTFNNVTFTVSGSIPSSTNVTVNATLTVNGNADLNGNTVTVTNSASGAVSGTGYFSGLGSLVRAFSGNNSYNFPFLDGSENRSPTVSFTAGAGTGTLSFQFFSDSPGIVGLPLTLISQLVTTVAPFYWQITSTGSPGTYTLTLNGSNMLGVTNISTLRISKRVVAGPWNDVGIGTSSSNSGTTTAPILSQIGMSGFGEYAISGNGSDNPLPVELLSFFAKATPDGADLIWRTSSETENAGFILYRDDELLASFSSFQALKGKGSTSSESAYHFTDSSATYGNTYRYQLKDVSFSGKVTAHDPIILHIDVERRAKGFTLYQNYPNPFNPSTSIKYQLPFNSDVSLVVYDVLGREVASLVRGQQNAGSYQSIFNANGFSSGIYFYKLEAKSQSGSFSQTKKMLLVK